MSKDADGEREKDEEIEARTRTPLDRTKTKENIDAEIRAVRIMLDETRESRRVTPQVLGLLVGI